jgi:hypothetical protein
MSVRLHPPVAASEGIVATAQHLRNGEMEEERTELADSDERQRHATITNEER